MVTQWVFFGFVILVAVQRLVELALSRRNESVIRWLGGIEYGNRHYRVMKVLHVSWFIAMVSEVFIFQRLFHAQLAIIAIVIFVIGQGLRYSAIKTLGWRWTVKVLTMPGIPVIDKGIYRYIRHPNYIGVVFEIFSVPLIHSAFLTSILYSIANLIMLRVRIRVEESALTRDSNYEDAFQTKPRFVPRMKI